ncbi:hypothetical protein GEMRC1_006259 [Eukaryota sp. GEM-RC1]
MSLATSSVCPSLDSSTCLVIPSLRTISLSESQLKDGGLFKHQTQTHSLHRLHKVISFFFDTVGYVSQRFFRCTFPAVKIFLEATTIPTSTELPKLSAFAAFFGSQINSVSLVLSRKSQPSNFTKYSSIITLLELSLFDAKWKSLLDHSSPHFLPRVTRVHCFHFSMESVRLMCKSLKSNTVVTDLYFEMDSFSSTEATSLAEMFYSNTTLTNVKLSLHSRYALRDEDVSILFNSLGANCSVQQLDLSNLRLQSFNSLLPLLNNSSIKTILFPRCDVSHSSFFDGLMDNSCLQELSFNHSNFCLEGLAEVIKFNKTLKKLTMLSNSCLSPIFKSLESNNALLELDLRCSGFDSTCLESLVGMLLRNRTLLVLTIDCSFAPANFDSVLEALATNPVLKKVSFPSLNLGCLILIFKAKSTQNSISNIHVDVAPHSIDVSRGIIHYDRMVYNYELSALLKALKSNFPINSVECRGLGDLNLESILVLFEILSINKSVIDVNSSPHFIDISSGTIHYQKVVRTDEFSLLLRALKSGIPLNRIECPVVRCGNVKGLVTLFEILSINKSLIDVDFAPHFVDVERGIFCYSPVKRTIITSQMVLNLKHLLSSFDVKDVISILSDLLSKTCSLTVIDFSESILIDEDFLISRAQFIPESKYVNLCTSIIGVKSLLTVFEQFYTHQSLKIVRISDHSIDFGSNLISYNQCITNDDLVQFLKVLKFNIPVKRLDCTGLKSPNLEGLINLFQILSINKSVINLDISPHLVDVENDVLCFSPKRSTKISAVVVSSLETFLNKFNVQGLLLKKCRFDEDAMTALSVLLRNNNSLTSLVLSHCKLSDENFKQIVSALQLNSSRLDKLSLGGNCIGNEGAIALADTLKENLSIKTISLGSNSIGNEGAESISQALLMNTNVTLIKLFSNPIDSKTKEYVCRISNDRVIC